MMLNRDDTHEGDEAGRCGKCGQRLPFEATTYADGTLHGYCARLKSDAPLREFRRARQRRVNECWS